MSLFSFWESAIERNEIVRWQNMTENKEVKTYENHI